MVKIVGESAKMESAKIAKALEKQGLRVNVNYKLCNF